MYALLIALAAGYGALTGLLAARPVARFSVEPGEPWARRCPQGHPWPVGVRGWLGSAACGTCGTAGPRGPASWPLVAAGAACSGLLAYGTGPAPELVVWLLLVPGMVAVTAVDIAVLRLPDPLTWGMGAVAVGGLGALALLPVSVAGSWTGAVLGGAVLSGGLFVLALISPRGMGLGDVKLSLPLGMVLGWYGWSVLVSGVFAGFLLAAVYAAGLVLFRGAGRKTLFSMGPFLALGTLIGVMAAGLAGQHG